MTAFARRHAGLIAMTAIVVLLPLILPNRFYTDMAMKSWFNAAICIGLNLLIGYTGQISLGHAGFIALGAYTSAILTSRYGVSGLVALPIGAIGVGLLAFAVARPILRLKGHYLAMATLGMGYIVAIVLSREIWLTGGPDGVTVPALWIGPWRVIGVETWYWIAGGAMLITIWLARNLIDSSLGRALRAVDGSEIAAETVGIDVTRAKVMVFVVSAVVAAVIGSLYAHAERFITPQEAGFLRSIELVTMVVLGGMASTFGAVVGAVILTVLPQALADFQDYKHLVFGAILMIVMIFMPRGLVPALRAMVMRR